MDWFKVPGQNCPVALGAPCEYTSDCNDLARKQTQCFSLAAPTQSSLGWTNSGAISSSSAGTLTCDPFRKVCGMMEKYEDIDHWWIGVD